MVMKTVEEREINDLAEAIGSAWVLDLEGNPRDLSEILMYCDIENIAKQLYEREYRKKSGWISVDDKEEMPTENCYVWATDGIRILKLRYVAKPNLAWDCTSVKSGDFTYERRDGDFEVSDMKVTHWMHIEIPDLPKTKGIV